MEQLPQYLVNGLVTGSFYALSALGLTLILGLMRVVNFAHGELYMMGGVMGWWATTRLGLDFFTGLLLVAVAMGAFGWLVDRLLIERIRDQGEEPGILLTIGLSIFLANTALLMVGTAPLKVEAPIAAGPVFLGTVVLTKLRLFAVGVCALLIVAAWLTIHKTRLGRAMRATFQDRWPRGWWASAPPASTPAPSPWARSSPRWRACCSARSTRRKCPWAGW